MKRLMSREMLWQLISIVELHKEENLELYEYLMMTWTACRYDSTLYACNVTGMTMCQRHLSEFDDQIVRLYNEEKKKGFNIL